MAANMDTVGTFDMAKSFQIGACDGLWPEDVVPLVAMSKHHIAADWEREYNLGQGLDYGVESPMPWGFDNCAITAGMCKGDKEKTIEIVNHYHNTDWPIRFVCLDVANGYTEKFVDFVKEMRECLQDKVVIVAGNVVTREMTEALVIAGADIVKVGIGPGSVCTTRKLTGVGYPQLSAVAECADAAHGLDAHVMADGGCTSAGDVAKAFAAGADFVMLGGMLAGHDECLGEKVVDSDGETYKEFYGMSSDTAMNKYNGGVATYRASEGKTVRVPHRGPVVQTLQEILGGVRSACTYVGARRLKDLPKCATFVKVHRQLNTVFGD
tara:strand:+ start:7440 stop:8411 length:972 start_codon:yes stop_codon:yes gene_type:complete